MSNETPRVMRDYSWCQRAHVDDRRRRDFRAKLADLASGGPGGLDSYTTAVLSKMEPGESVVALAAGFELSWEVDGYTDEGTWLSFPRFEWLWMMATDRWLRLGRFELVEQRMRVMDRFMASEKDRSYIPQPMVGESGHSAYRDVRLEYSQFPFVVAPETSVYEDENGERIWYHKLDVAIASRGAGLHPVELGVISGWFGAADKEVYFFVEDGSAAQAEAIVNHVRNN